MLKAIGSKIFGSNNDRELKKLRPAVAAINELESKFEGLSIEELRGKTSEFRERLDNGETLDSLLIESFAVVREASKQVLGMRHFDCQLVGGMVLHNGIIAEMKTGEGKTLTATLPVYLNALTGKGVHVVTVNDYLAQRDAEWMGTLYGALGLSTGCVVNGNDHLERQEAYGSDVTYGQNNEFGFDYLRDNMKLTMEEMAQREHNFAIVDEVDSILIDEARTPLIISGPSDATGEKFLTTCKITPKLVEEEHYTIDLKSKQTMLTDEGVEKVESILKIENLYDPQSIDWLHHINQSLKAEKTFKRDVDYVVRGGKVLIVDEFTGRLMDGRRWSDGLHQAVEAKEGVDIQRENQTLASITFQNYFRLYKKLSGMTGTADTEAVEFKKVYNLDVIVVPTNKPTIREDNADVIYLNEGGKFQAVCDELKELNKEGQPVLVGTASIAKSEVLSEFLKKKGVKHNVLNAKQHEKEAEIVAQAGRLGSVTISTNMAGRGTDILLGGNPEFLAAAEAGTTDPEDPAYLRLLEKFKKECAVEKQQVLDKGGLHILGTERHESRRIDNQLRGRSGRQGDPGSSRFYVSLEDELIKRFAGESLGKTMRMIGMKEEDAIENRHVSSTIERAQRKVEGHHFDHRKHLLDFDNVMNVQRETVYALRRDVLTAETLVDRIKEITEDVLEEGISGRIPAKEPVVTWPVENIVQSLNGVFGLSFDEAEYEAKKETSGKELAQDIFDAYREAVINKYQERRTHIGEDYHLGFERHVMLETIDNLWRKHLAAMDQLKEGIGLRGYAQKNPLYEYQREAYELFNTMMAAIKATFCFHLFNVELRSKEEIEKLQEEERQRLKQLEEQSKTVHEDMSANDSESSETAAGNRKQRRRQGGKKAGGVQEQLRQKRLQKNRA